MHRFYTTILITSIMASCTNNPNKTSSSPTATSSTYQPGTFGYDLAFLQQHDSVISLAVEGEPGQVLVSPKYQGKVFTSTAEGNEGKSFGWINYKAFTAPVDAHMNAYGGENRFWLGPEGNRFSLYFEPGKDMVFDNWKTPAPFDTEPWTVVSSQPASVTMQKEMGLKNYAGTTLQLKVDRSIAILDKKKIASQLNIVPAADVKSVGYLASNQITNTGKEAWNEKTGMPCIWMLDMFNPSEKTVIAIPYKTVKDASAKIATTDYFGEIAADRIQYHNGVLLFKADGKSRGKLGLDPHRATHLAGSYDAAGKVLTIIQYDLDPSGRYLNQEWNTKKPPFSGDAVNAYNDGPLQNGSQMGPFYELESVSPAAFLQPGGTLAHNHAVFHFTGSASSLDQLASKILGVSIREKSEP
ncbi:MAG: hypothetical protein INR73_23775 [Williamsia sp.]|nr:hypothetical protein [Williamsia sp.]